MEADKSTTPAANPTPTGSEEPHNDIPSQPTAVGAAPIPAQKPEAPANSEPVATPPAEESPTPPPAEEKHEAPAVKTSKAAPAPKQPSNLPLGFIITGIIFLVVLTALAYMAYTNQ